MCVYFQWQGMDCINEKEPVCFGGAHIVASLLIHCQFVCASNRHMLHGKKRRERGGYISSKEEGIWVYIYIYSMKHVPVVPLFNVKNSC